MAIFPRQDILEKEKTKDWVRRVFQYADDLLSASNPRIAKFTRLYNEYNGRVDTFAIEYLTKTYGKKNRARYISYRWARPKIDLLNNEFLLRPLDLTVYAVNEGAKTEKMENFNLMAGAIAAKPAITKLRQAGVDPLEGMDIPDEMTDDVMEGLSARSAEELIMQIIIDEQTITLLMKLKLSKCFQDLEIVGECYSRTFVDKEGNEDFVRVDPRNRICEDIEEDYFFERSPVKGHKELIPIHDILNQFELTKEQKDKLEQERTSWDPATRSTASFREAYSKVNGALCARVIFLEWKGWEASYTKVSPKTQKQLNFDDSSSTYELQMKPEWYEKNPDEHKKQSEKFNQGIADGKIPSNSYDTKIGWKEVAYREVRIGEDIYVYSSKAKTDTESVAPYIKAPYSLHTEDNRKSVYDLTYTGCRLNVVNGETISLQELVENFSNALDINMFQILKELNRAKGKTMWFNQDGLPRNKKIREIMYDAVNDGFVAYSASGAKNDSGRDIDPKDIIKETDWGISSSFPYLLQLKQQLLETIDRLTGINQQREGDIAATSTATNAQSQIRSSKTITEGIFYMMSLFVEKVYLKLLQTSKLTWGLNETKGRVILGDKLFRYLKTMESIAYQDYGLHLVDGGRAISLREKWEQDAQAALQAKDIRFKDLVEFDLAPNYLMAKQVLLKAYDEMDKIRAQQQQQESQAQQQMNANNIASQEKMAKEDREDKQKNEKENIVLKADQEIRVGKALGTHKAKTDLILQDHQAESEHLTNNLQPE